MASLPELPELAGDRVVPAFVDVVNDVDPITDAGIVQLVVAESAEVRPAVRQGAYRPAQVVVPHHDRIDVAAIDEFRRADQACGQPVIDRNIRLPQLWPLEV